MTSMSRAKLWLILTAVLFASWIGYLVFRVVNLKEEARAGGGLPVVLSRPQLLAADLIVTAEVEGKEEAPTTAKVVDSHWSRDGDAGQWEGKVLTIDNLADSQGLAEGGAYILPLVRIGKDFRVAPIPPSPGYPPPPHRPGETGPPQVYRSTVFTQEQLRHIIARR